MEDGPVFLAVESESVAIDQHLTRAWWWALGLVFVICLILLYAIERNDISEVGSDSARLLEHCSRARKKVGASRCSVVSSTSCTRPVCDSLTPPNCRVNVTDSVASDETFSKNQ